MEFVVSTIVGIGSSVIASILFIHVYLARKKPSIVISDVISNESSSTGPLYWFKYVNKTKVPIYDVTVEAYFLTPVGGDGGQNLRIDEIPIKHRTYTNVPSESKMDKNALHAVQVKCDRDLLAMWTNQASYIRFQVIGKHELSGFSKVFVQDYHNKNKIRTGSFKFGNDLNIS